MATPKDRVGAEHGGSLVTLVRVFEKGATEDEGLFLAESHPEAMQALQWLSSLPSGLTPSAKKAWRMVCEFEPFAGLDAVDID